MLAASAIVWREKSACVHSRTTKLPPQQGAARIISFDFSISTLPNWIPSLCLKHSHNLDFSKHVCKIIRLHKFSNFRVGNVLYQKHFLLFSGRFQMPWIIFTRIYSKNKTNCKTTNRRRFQIHPIASYMIVITCVTNDVIMIFDLSRMFWNCNIIINECKWDCYVPLNIPLGMCMLPVYNIDPLVSLKPTKLNCAHRPLHLWGLL